VKIIKKNHAHWCVWETLFGHAWPSI
jgi:hypothetical protein